MMEKHGFILPLSKIVNSLIDSGYNIEEINDVVAKISSDQTFLLIKKTFRIIVIFFISYLFFIGFF